MNILSNVSNKYLTVSNSVLLALVIITIFLIPLFPIQWHKFSYNFFFTLIFLLSALALSKHREGIFKIALLVIIIEWISEILNFPIFIKISLIINIAFFSLIVTLLILQVARAKTVTLQVIMQSVNGYLMFGLSFSILISLVCVIDPTAFSFKHFTEPMNTSVSYMSDYIYFGIVSLTTVGYGDVLPITPAAKSLSNFISVTGQMYVAIIIAALVSKYLNQKSLTNRD